jgi:large subunit ribosomal protein L4
MADKEKDTKKKAAPAAKAASGRETRTATAPAAKAKAASPATAKAAPKRAPRPKTAARRAVARPATRVVRPRAAEAPRPREEEKRAEPRPKIAPQPLPTAPSGHAPVIGPDGKASGSVELPAALATATPRRGVLFQALMAALANARQATSATKNRSRVAGGGAKPWRQKGTGRARQGSTRAPHWRHGGVVFGPNGRRYEQRMPAKMRRAAFAEAIAGHAANGRIFVIDDLRFDGVEGDRPRTRDIAGWLARVGDTGRAVLVTAEPDERVGIAAANLKQIELRTAGTLRLADVLRAQTMLVHRPALDALAARATVGTTG